MFWRSKNMKNFKLWILSFFFCLALGVFCFFYFSQSNASCPSLLYGKMKMKRASSCLPVLEVEIENKKIPVILDLGFSGYTVFDNLFVHGMSDKQFLRQSWKYGFRGIKRYHDVYRIPKMRIGDLTYTNLEVNERDPAFNEESTVFLDKEKFVPDPFVLGGEIGWMLFNNLILFLDMKQSKMVVCGSLEKFEKAEHSLKSYTKTPLMMDRDLVEIETVTSHGVVKCLLDTGCTCNFINTGHSTDEPLERIVRNESGFTTLTSFKIGEHDFGPVSFRPLPIQLPINIQAILGMEFFDQHRVLIDFKNRQAYFAKN